MIKIICDDDFLKKKLLHLYDQQNFFFSLHKTDQYFFEIIIFKKENCLEISIKDKKINLYLPKSFNEIHEKIYKIISNISIILQKHEYFPLKQMIKNNDRIPRRVRPRTTYFLPGMLVTVSTSTWWVLSIVMVERQHY